MRLRAERRAGQLMAELKRSEAPNPAGVNGATVASKPVTQPKSEYAAAIERTGISRQTANRWQGLAAVPADFLRFKRKNSGQH